MKKQTVDKGLLIKSSFWYTVANFLTKAISFITIPIFTRLMSKQEYADFSVFASWQSLFLIICGIETYATLNRARFDYESEESLNSYITSSLLLSTFATGIFFVVFLLFPHFFDRLFLLDRKYIYFMFAYLFMQPAFQMFQAKQRVEYRYKLSAGLSFFLIIFSTLLAVFLVYSIEDKLLGRIIGHYVPFTIVGLIFYIYFVIKAPSLRLDNWAYALKLGLPLVFSFLGSQILLSSDRVVVQHIGTHEEVAWLVLATSASNIILLFVQTLNNAWAPWFFDKIEAGGDKEIKKTLGIYMWLIVFGTFVVLLIGPEIVMILGGKQYTNSIYVLPANMLCGILTAISSQFVNMQIYYKKTHYAAILTFIVAIINIIGDIIGVKAFGYQAACYVTVLCQIILIVLHYFVSKQFAIIKVLPVKRLILILGVSLLMIPIFLILYQYNMARLVVALVSILVIGVVMYKKKHIVKKIFGLLKAKN